GLGCPRPSPALGRTCYRWTAVTMTTTEASSKCLDAFTLALYQACDGDDYRWYV
ncbi:unnamed protein product, partial [Ectocarpus fasciculatus]